MTNEEKYNTPNERNGAFRDFCDSHHSCSDCAIYNMKGPRDPCAFIWLTFEAEEEKPLPCPFCGGEAEVLEGYSVMPKGTFVQCKNCWAFVAGFKTKTDAIAAWNRRVK